MVKHHWVTFTQNKVLFEIPRRPPPTVQDTSQWSEGFVQFISACLVKDYEHRPRAGQLLAEQSFVTFDEPTHDVYRDLLRTCHLRYLSLNLPNKFVESDRSTTINEDDAMNRNPWIANISKSADAIDQENNLAQLNDLDQQSLMNSIRRRFNQALIYTYVGDVLLAINPKQFLPIDNFNFQLKYSRARRDLLPHIFAVATTVYNQMTINRQAQCIILSGESGSGESSSVEERKRWMQLGSIFRQNTCSTEFDQWTRSARFRRTASFGESSGDDEFLVGSVWQCPDSVES